MLLMANSLNPKGSSINDVMALERGVIGFRDYTSESIYLYFKAEWNKWEMRNERFSFHKYDGNDSQWGSQTQMLWARSAF